ncbi:hypothetical protein NUW54_g3616 [Trametes sanguinea]|uniref:Uncharacterized protein n=1 Tax=Trametes sanguinea TaxID=158606 RepID=A0ACC1Q082_9APHY|nr:hypothetical protein NUW54_g3616 [Trametes sanguinea]
MISGVTHDREVSGPKRKAIVSRPQVRLQDIAPESQAAKAYTGRLIRAPAGMLSKVTFAAAVQACDHRSGWQRLFVCRASQDQLVLDRLMNQKKTNAAGSMTAGPWFGCPKQNNMRNLHALLQLTLAAVATARTLTVVNSCSYTVWPALFNNAGSSIPNQPTGWQQNPQQTISFSVPDTWAGQLWGRRDCDFSATNGPSSCLDGGCDGGLECTGTAAPPATIAEFELNVNQQDFYDVSLVSGFNIPLSVTNNKGCATVSCPVDLNPGCPADLAGPFDASGNPVGCKSACAAGLGDPGRHIATAFPEYGSLSSGGTVNNPNCCTGAHSTPATCPASGVEYYSYFTMSKRIRIFTEEDVSKHASSSSCWVTRNGKVYDVTQFLPDHPGGEDYILNYGGKDIGAIMKDASEHDHSDSAYDMLEEFVIGRVVQGETLVSERLGGNGRLRT